MSDDKPIRHGIHILRLVQVSEGVSDDPERPVGEINMLSDPDMARHIGEQTHPVFGVYDSDNLVGLVIDLTGWPNSQGAGMRHVVALAQQGMVFL